MAICFEVSINGQRPVVAGSEDVAVLSVILSYVAKPAGELDIAVGALVTRPSGDDEHWSWLQNTLKPGDQVVIRVIEGVRPEEPMERTPQSADFSEKEERAYYERLRLKYDGP